MVNISLTSDYNLIAELNEEIQNLHSELFPQFFKPYQFSEIKKAIENMMSESNCRCYIANEAGQPLGYIILMIKEIPSNAFQFANQYVYIDQIAVLKTHQKKGIGQLLMQKAEDLAIENNIARIELNHWTANTNASSYFQKKGYQVYRESLYKDNKS